MTFTAMDVETANADFSSICQIGLATYENGNLTSGWKTYIDPEDYFDEVNTDLHKITEETVRGAPKLPEVAAILCAHVGNRAGRRADSIRLRDDATPFYVQEQGAYVGCSSTG